MGQLTLEKSKVAARSTYFARIYFAEAPKNFDLACLKKTRKRRFRCHSRLTLCLAFATLDCRGLNKKPISALNVFGFQKAALQYSPVPQICKMEKDKSIAHWPINKLLLALSIKMLLRCYQLRKLESENKKTSVQIIRQSADQAGEAVQIPVNC